MGSRDPGFGGTFSLVTRMWNISYKNIYNVKHEQHDYEQRSSIRIINISLTAFLSNFFCIFSICAKLYIPSFPRAFRKRKLMIRGAFGIFSMYCVSVSTFKCFLLSVKKC